MNCPFDPSRRRALASLTTLATLAVAAPAALAAPPARAHTPRIVSDFDTRTWAQLLTQGPRPAAYVFTNTFCATCPEVFELLHRTVRARRQPVELIAILMDVQGEQALAHAHHYEGVTQIYAFNGFEPEIRQSVDAQWRNITPYVVLVDHRGAVQRTIGPPSRAQLRRWLG